MEWSKVILDNEFNFPSIVLYEWDKEMIYNILITALFNHFKKQIFPIPMADVQPETITDWKLIFTNFVLYLSYDFLQMQKPPSPKEILNLNSSRKMT